MVRPVILKIVTKVTQGTVFIALALAASTAALGDWYLKPVIINQAARAEAASLSFTSWVLETGARPEAWDTRAFLPVAAIRDLAGALAGLEFVATQGKRDDAGHYDGRFVIRLDQLIVETGTSQLRPQLAVTASYVPDRVDHWWSSARVALKIEAQFMPVVGADPKTGNAAVKVLVVPTSIRPILSWNPIEIFSAARVVSEILAAGVLLKYGDELSLMAPAIKSPLRVETKIDSTSHSKFAKDGGFDLQVRMGGPTFERLVEADVPLVTSRGIWILGRAGQQLPNPIVLPDDPAELQKTADQLRLAVAAKIGAFERSDAIAEVRISNRQIMEIAAEIKQPWKPGQNVIDISSANANGTIADAFLLKDEFLGNVGLTVTPRVQDFLSGAATVHPPQFQWIPGTGLSATVAASARATASLHVHLATGAVGGGVGKDVDLRGETDIALSALLKLEKRETSAGTAVVLQPHLSCTRIEIDVNPATREDIIKEAWIALKPFGVRVKRSVGGGQQTPSIVLDSLATAYVFGDADGDSSGKESFFRRKGVQVSWTINDVQVQDDGLLILAGVAVGPGPVEPGTISDAAKAALKEALKASAPDVPCEPEDSYALLLLANQVEIGPNNEIVVLIKRLVAEGVHVADETKKEIEKLTTKPFDSVIALPENTLREGGKALENISKAVDAAANAAKNPGGALENAICGKKCVLGQCVRIC
jgi:hypothetical protein